MQIPWTIIGRNLFQVHLHHQMSFEFFNYWQLDFDSFGSLDSPWTAEFLSCIVISRCPWVVRHRPATAAAEGPSRIEDCVTENPSETGWGGLPSSRCTGHFAVSFYSPMDLSWLIAFFAMIWAALSSGRSSLRAAVASCRRAPRAPRHFVDTVIYLAVCQLVVSSSLRVSVHPWGFSLTFLGAKNEEKSSNGRGALLEEGTLKYWRTFRSYSVNLVIFLVDNFFYQ
jgi:hypothetical protein